MIMAEQRESTSKGENKHKKHGPYLTHLTQPDTKTPKSTRYAWDTTKKLRCDDCDEQEEGDLSTNVHSGLSSHQIPTNKADAQDTTKARVEVVSMDSSEDIFTLQE